MKKLCVLFGLLMMVSLGACQQCPASNGVDSASETACGESQCQAVCQKLTENKAAAEQNNDAAQAPVAQAVVKTPIPAGDAEIALPKPSAIDVTLTKALTDRRSVRAYTDECISLEELSTLLWAANGVNREDGKRTAPSAMNKQSVSIYVTLEKGAYKYDAAAHKLIQVAAADVRPLKLAPVELVLTSFMENEVIRGIDIGVVTQNAALYAASEGLATVIRMMRGDVSEIRAALKLEDADQVVCNMAIGFEAQN